MTAAKTTEQQLPASKPLARQPYSPPVLRLFGAIGALTKGGGPSGNGDGLAMTQPMSSDRSIKENIVCVGKHSSGVGLYLFDYKPAYRAAWGSQRQLGVMADEVAAVMPEAVQRHADGYFMVDYGLLNTQSPAPVGF